MNPVDIINAADQQEITLQISDEQIPAHLCQDENGFYVRTRYGAAFQRIDNYTAMALSDIGGNIVYVNDPQNEKDKD